MALLLLSGLTSTTIATYPATAQSLLAARSAPADPHALHVAEASSRFGIPATWIAAVMQAESAGELRAVSTAGAMGLMQIMPDTWTALRIRHGLGRDAYDPRDNILAGTAYLREMWDRYNDITAMLAAYNAGPARYDEHRSTSRPLPAETRAYITSLAPVLRGARPLKSGAAAIRPRNWREASLFVVRDDGVAGADRMSFGRTSGDARSPVPASPQTLSPVPPRALFVARNGAGDRP